jgi:molybdate transport system ATP-binding protein
MTGGIRAFFRMEWPGFALDVDLALPDRGVIAVFGPSGSGKTTLLRCIAGLERPLSGMLSFRGETWQSEVLWLPPHRRPIGYVFQDSCLFPHLTVMGNLQYGMKRAAFKDAANLDKVIHLLGIGQLLERNPDSLSGGERQRVGLARALAVGPRLLLLDEPLAALDLNRKREILPYLERMRDELEIPMLYVSHSPEEVSRLADHLVVLEAGKAVASGTLAEVLARVDAPIKMGEEPGVVLEAVVAAIDPEWNLARVEFEGGSLWVRDAGLPAGRKARIRILARDVSLAKERPGTSSIQNALKGTIDAVGKDTHPALALARLRVGRSALLARLTRRSAAELGVAAGGEFWAQIKSAALIEW